MLRDRSQRGSGEHPRVDYGTPGERETASNPVQEPCATCPGVPTDTYTGAASEQRTQGTTDSGAGSVVDGVIDYATDTARSEAYFPPSAGQFCTQY